MNDVMRIKILAKNGHTDIELVDLPREMTKGEIAQHMAEIDFAKGRKAVADAISYVAKKKPAAPVKGPAGKKAAPEKAAVTA